MLDGLLNFFQGLGQFIEWAVFGIVDLIVGFFEFIGAIAGHLYLLITDFSYYIQTVLPAGLVWIWENWLVPIFEALYNTIGVVPLQAILDLSPLATTIHDNYVQHFIDAPAVLGMFLVVVQFTVMISIFKFTLKRIPVIGG